MRKIQLISSILISILLVGCQTQKQTDSHNSSIASENAITQVKQDEDEMIYGENGLPPLDGKLLEFYKECG